MRLNVSGPFDIKLSSLPKYEPTFVTISDFVLAISDIQKHIL